MQLKTAGLLQIWALMAAHFVGDMMGGLLPGVLPVLREYFNLSEVGMVAVLAVYGGSCNIFQIPAGALRKNARTPFLLYLGLVLLLLAALLGLLPRSTPLWALLLYLMVFGWGGALIHPEGVRGAMQAPGLSSTATTSLFMVSGFFGYSFGPLLGAVLVNGAAGLRGLLWSALPVLAVLLFAWRVRIRLATGRARREEAGPAGSDRPWSFAWLFIIAFFINSGSTILQGLLPTYLKTIGFSLEFGGYSYLIFGCGSALGSIAFGLLARKIRPSRLVTFGLGAGVPLLIAYLGCSASRWAPVLLFFAGLLVSSGFPLLVVLARHAESAVPLGVRMGVIVGGTWGLAALVVLATGPFIRRFGLPPVMHAVWVCYLAAFALAVWPLLYGRKQYERR